jgi:uncharacterized membrane protein
MKAGVLLSLILAASSPAGAEDGAVKAVLFLSPTCPHCRVVREEALPAFTRRFGSRIQIAVVSTARWRGRQLYTLACGRFSVDRPVVPMLVVGDTVLFGDKDIPERFPEIAESLLAAGGSDWPDIPGLRDALNEDIPVTVAVGSGPARSEGAPRPRSRPATAPAASAATPVPAGPPASAPDRTPRAADRPGPAVLSIGGDQAPGPLERLSADPIGNGLAVGVLIVMVAVLLLSPFSLARRLCPEARTSWAPPVLAVAGLLVASYLARVEITHAEAACGPVGDCHTVQQSEYATLFGVVPVGVLGIVAFGAVLAAWALRRVSVGRAADYAGIALFAVTGVGVLFSIYLTFLEPFVIGATCLWCLSSAMIMTLLYGLSLEPGHAALNSLLGLRPVGRTGHGPLR